MFRKALFFALLAVLTAHPALAQTQEEMNQQAWNSYHAADLRMSGIYAKILKQYASDPAFIKSLKASQRAWLAYRDAEMKAIYPDREPGYYGTIQPVCESGELEALTESRIKELERWIHGVEEGDACAGSVRMKRHS